MAYLETRLLPLFVGGRLNGMREEDTGIVYQHINAAQVRSGLIYERPDRGRITKVSLNDHMAITGQ